MGHAVIIGAGKEGKGTFGDIFNEAGWGITFLDTDERVIEALRGAGSYGVEALYADRSERHEVGGFDALVAGDTSEVREALKRADAIMLALYPEDIDSALGYLASGLAERLADPAAGPVTIVLGTNKNRLVSGVANALRTGLPEGLRARFDRDVAVRDMIVRRSSNAERTWDLELTTKVVQTLVIQSPVTFDAGEFPWFELCDRVEMMKDIKIFTYNSPHAACAYAGYRKGYRTIEEAEVDPEVRALMDGVLAEAMAGVLAEYPLTRGELAAFVAAPKPLGSEEELISRVGVDPLRKLARNDRLVGPAMLCDRHGLPADRLLRAVACGMAYDEPDDPAAMKIQQLIAEEGIGAAVTEVTGIPAGHPFATRIAGEYEKLR